MRPVSSTTLKILPEIPDDPTPPAPDPVSLPDENTALALRNNPAYQIPMLKSLLSRLKTPSNAPLPADDARIALAAMLVQAARADDDYAEAERTVIDQALANRYSLTHSEASALRAEGEAAEAASVDLVSFTRLIKRAVPIEDRHHILEALWRVILADETRDPHENAMARQTAHLLGVPDRDSAIARNRAAHDLGLTP